MKKIQMITRPLSRIERSVFCVCFAVVVLVYALGAGVHVSWGSAPIPVSQVLASFRFGSLFDLEEAGGWIIAFAGAGLLGFRYVTMASCQFRVLLLSVGLLVSLLIVSNLIGSFWNAVGLVGYALPMTLQALFGLANGEFYVEGLLEFAAAGLWVLLCIGFLIREFVGMARNRALAEPGASPNGGSVTSTDNLDFSGGPPSVS